MFSCYMAIYAIYYLVGGFMIFIVHFLYGMSNPSHWRIHIFQDGYCTTKQYVYNIYILYSLVN